MKEAGRSILDVLMICPKCDAISTVGACEPDVDGEGSLGCPQEDCGGVVRELFREER